MRHEADIRVGGAIELLAKLALDDLRGALQNDGALHDEVHVLGAAHAVDLGIHEMEGDGGHLALGKLHTQPVENDLDTAMAELSLAWIHEGDLVGQGIFD